MFKRMRKIALIMCCTLLFSGCVKTGNTVTINKDNTATMEKVFEISASSATMSSDLAESQKKFVTSFKETYPGFSIMKYKIGDAETQTSRVVGKVKFKDITKEDIFQKEAAFTAASKGGKLDCKKKKNETACSFDVNVNLQIPELEKKMTEYGMTSKDLDPYELTFKIPVKPDKHNADFFDSENFVYLWEIPWGSETHVVLNFTIPQ